MAHTNRAYKCEPIVVQVVERVKQVAFRFGRLHFDQLLGHHVIVSWEKAIRPIPIEIKRGGRRYDAGFLYLSSATVDADDFDDFRLIRPDGRPFLRQSVLEAVWFTVGDEICFSADRTFLRASLEHNMKIACKEAKCRKGGPRTPKIIPCRY